jgi:hypothetical protein
MFGCCLQASLSALVSILSVRALRNWVRAKFDVFKIFLKIILVEKFAKAQGNPFAQGVHDGGTLTNKRKYQVFGLQFVDSKWRWNHVICIGLERCGDGRDVAVADLFRETLLKNDGLRFDDIVSSVIQDMTAK